MTKHDPKQKARKQKSNQQTAVWEKRQMGNFLLIIILGFRNCLAELGPSKVNFTEKKQPCAGRAGQHVLR